MRDTLARNGDLGRDLLAVDWESTSLGPPEDWPRSLQTVVRMLLTSRFSMWMAWGPELTFFCNEAYRRDTLGKKYPWALGRPASEVWSEIWEDISPRIERVIRSGEATWDESLLLFLVRSGYVEETYHTFSYSPLHDDTGAIIGMLCVVSEDTEEVVSRRRLQVLSDLGSRSTANLSQAETVTSACEQLATSSRELPFTLVYLYDEATARLAGSSGFTMAHPAAPAVLSPAAGVWPVSEVAGGASVVVTDLVERFTALPAGGWDDPPTQALVVPLAQSSQAAPYGLLVAGLNPYRPLDQDCRAFLDLVAGQLASGITDARAYEFERGRAESLAALDQAKTDFFTNISHEFRTPLTLLLGPAEDALSDPDAALTDRQRGRVEVILRNSQRLLKLVNTLLDFSRLESGRVEPSFEPVDLAQYTRELASMFETAAARAGLRFTLDIDALPEPVHVDRDLWAKVVLNLLSNALKFTFTGGITVSLVTDDGRAVLEVSDTGTGVPEDELGHLFERFHRVSGARSRTHEGSGIGLALVSELAEVHGGDVGVRSTLGEGTTFMVRVPLGSAHLAPERIVDPQTAPRVDVLREAAGFLAESQRWLGGPGADEERAAPRPDRSLPRVLVVDDNRDIREYVAGLLSDDYDVRTAVDGEDGLEKARAELPDLVLTDVMMPRLDGFGLLAALQADPATLGVPVVMLSARAGEDGMVEGLDAGADDYLIKPFTARELLARVRANLELDRARRTREHLERSQALLDQAQRLARVGSWEIDLESGRIGASEELLRILGRSREELDALSSSPGVLEALVHPDDRAVVEQALRSGFEGVNVEARLLRPTGDPVLVLVHGELVADHEPVILRGSVQDITERRAAALALAAAEANSRVAAREHAIADELQRSLLPQRTFDLSHLDVATYYRAGVEGTQVGGDWYDIIELGAGRTALVVGDVMGRGVQAAAVMGQLRAAVRAYARLDLPPTDLLEFLDGIVRELGEDQIVTCLYAVFDPAAHVLSFANAGHLPPLLATPDGACRRLSGGEDPPLGAGPFVLEEHEVKLGPNSTVVLYTDGLVERRGHDLEAGIDALAAMVAQLGSRPEDALAGAPERMVAELMPEGPDDDVAVLIARVDAPRPSTTTWRQFQADDPGGVAQARTLVADHLRKEALPHEVVEDAVLIASELVTNALRHGRLPVDFRIRTDGHEVMLEVRDRDTFRPHKLRPDVNNEHGRGLQIVAALSDRWGTRATEDGKSVWCLLSAPRASA